MCCGKREKGPMHRTEGLTPTGRLAPFWEALFSAVSPIKWRTQHPFLVASMLAYGP